MSLREDIRGTAELLQMICVNRRLRIATVESCTGGLIAGAITEIPGASDYFDRGFVTYSNAAKAELGVPADLIERFGAVSAEVAIAMAEGALATSGTDFTLSVTGIAGPGGGTPEKPVGLVHFGVARRGEPTHQERVVFPDNGRSGIRQAAVLAALQLMIRRLAPA